MRASFLVLTAVTLIAGCAGAPERQSQTDYSLPPAHAVSADTGIQPETPPSQHQLERGSNIPMNAVDRVTPRGFNPVPGLERMPFGYSAFGAWDVGGTGPDDPASRPAERFVSRDLHTVVHYISLRSGLRVIVEAIPNLKLSVGIPKPSNRAEALAVLRAICQAHQLQYVEDGEYIILKAATK